jgi:hypothetical protein
LGSLTTQNGINIVQPDFILSAIDIVADPSGPNCFVEGIMEGKEWIFDATAKSWVIAEQIKSNIKKMTTKQITETKAAFFQMFLNGLK